MNKGLFFGISAIALTIIGIVDASKECRFALQYSQEEIIHSQTTRNEFLQRVIEKETAFLRELGVDMRTGLTIGNISLNPRIGLPINEQQQQHIDMQNEALHIAILTKSIIGESNIYPLEESIQILKLKLKSVREFLIPSMDITSLYYSIQGLVSALATVKHQEGLLNECNNFLKDIENRVQASNLLSNFELVSLLVPLKDIIVSSDYLISMGQQQLSKVDDHFPYYLGDQLGAAWHHSYLLNSKSQTKYGLSNQNNLSFYRKALTVLQILGGIQDHVKISLEKQGKLQNLKEQIEQALTMHSLKSQDIPYPTTKELSIESLQAQDYTSCRLMDVPNDFAWGVATAAYQIEGAAFMDGRGPSIWDDFCKLPGTINNGDSGEVADDFYHKYKQDVAMMKKMGIKHFRMSLSWSRILPGGTTDKGINGLGVAFYNYVINELLAAGITPWVTLHHWDTPSALHNNTDKGSFLSKDITDSFNNYADFVFAAYGDRVKHWITLNEPWTYSVNGYLTGVFAPGRCSTDPKCQTNGGGGNSATEPYIVTHNLMLAHAKAAKTYKTKYQQQQRGVIGFTTNTDHAVPYDETNPDDIAASSRQLAFAFGWFVDPCIFGKYPDEMTSLITDGRLPTFTTEESELIKGSVDFIGLNHYSSSYVKNDPTGTGGNWFSDSRTISTKIGKDGKLIGPQAESPWLNVYPPGIRGVLQWIDKRYNHPIVYVFENGVSVPHENQMPISEALHDQFRIDFYKGYIQNTIDAMTIDGVDLRGYFAWSLMDNFEWADGYSTRFGMTYVDYKDNQKRYIKDSLAWYSQFTKTGNINASFVNSDSHLIHNSFSKEKAFLE